ncbi:hypothetical protein BOX15_Mlig020788g1 [Macrostomum lignano]|uniref:Lig_chan-Glu_bd domain-containing protein n=2 Tax=Macrostomum lignano TaxID=282301 RepID=A0A267ETQ6_9PLAT|nr:hypothetical protein BOX15_Mlig020788g1 [Macrostomum lignano]
MGLCVTPLLLAIAAGLSAGEELRIGLLLPSRASASGSYSNGVVQQIEAFNRSSDGTSVQILGLTLAMDYALPEVMQSWQPHFIISFLSCPLPPATVASAGSVEIVLDAADCLDAAAVAGTGSAIILQSAALPAAAVELTRNFSSIAVGLGASVTGASAKLLSRLSSAWQQNRQLSLVPLDEGGNSTSALLSADAALLLERNRTRLAEIMQQSCNASIVLAYPVLLNDTGNDCPYCQLSPANLTDPFAHYGSRPGLCQLLDRLSSVVRPSELLQTSSVLKTISDTVRTAGGSVGVAAAMQIIRDSLVERQFVQCRSSRSGTLGYHGWFGLGSGLDLTRALATQRRSLLEGRHLIIGLKMVAPFSFAGSVTPEGFEVNVTGLAIDMLDEIARRLKFTYSLRQPADGLWGGVYPNGTWNGMVKEILDRKIDFAIGPFTMTAIRQTVIDFSEAFMEDGNTILIKKPGQENPMFRVLSPFSLNSWLAILGSVFTAAVCMFLFSYLSPFSAWNMNLSEKISDEVSIRENFWSIVGSLLQQGQDFYPVASSSRFVLGFWWIVTVVMMAYYTADMIGYLTLNIPAATVKNLEELAGQTVIRPVVKSGTNVQTLFQTSAPGSTYSKIYSLMTDMPFITETYQGVDLVANGTQQYAYISDSTQLRYIALTNCDLLLLSDIFNVATFGWPMRKSAVYKADINREIRSMIDSGLIARWIQKWWRAENICSQDSSLSDSKPIGIEESSGGFIIAAGFYACGLVVLLMEYVADALTRWCKQQPNRPRGLTAASYRTTKDHY